MVKKSIMFIAIMSIISLIAVFAAFILNTFGRPPPDILDEAPAHRAYLVDFLACSGLTFVPVATNDFAYYELHTADEQVAGFVFHGTEEGFAGPINLFVKTDVAGVIQRVHVWRHTETPFYVIGLNDFLATFADHKAESELVWQEDVHGITGATATAEAIIAAVHAPGKTAHQKGIFVQRENNER